MILRGDRRYLNLSPDSVEYGPRDDPRDDDDRVFECPCGVLYSPGGWWTAHNFERCDRT